MTEALPLLGGAALALVGLVAIVWRRPTRKPTPPPRRLQQAQEARHDAAVRRVETQDQEAAAELDRVAALDPAERNRRAAELMRDL